MLAKTGARPPYLLRKAVRLAEPGINGRLTIRMDGVDDIVIGNGEPGIHSDITVHNPKLFKRLFSEGWVGFTDAYLEGWWDTSDLQAFLDHMHSVDLSVYDHFEGSIFAKMFSKLRFWLQSNTKSQARKNISYHYDLGNEFYALWLDETMTYSSAIFETGQESFEAAQTAKYKSMVDQMGAQPGDHVLEIGCGWGGFAEYAAKERGLKVTGLTISQEQFDYAVKRVADAGLSDMVEIKMQDYRDETGQYDGIASIEMFEAVGEAYWPVYFDTVKKCLKPGKQATLQIITVADARWEVYSRGVDFIQKYIFPGGMLPAPKILRAQVDRAGLEYTGSIEFGESYSQTLRRWNETFQARWTEISSMNFDTRFKRMWEFYLCSCASAFRFDVTDVTQVTLRRPG